VVVSLSFKNAIEKTKLGAGRHLTEGMIRPMADKSREFNRRLANKDKPEM
jgi:hypothetical protein